MFFIYINHIKPFKKINRSYKYKQCLKRKSGVNYIRLTELGNAGLIFHPKIKR